MQIKLVTETSCFNAENLPLLYLTFNLTVMPWECVDKIWYQKTRVPAEDMHRWQYVSIFISFHAIIFQSRAVLASHTGAKTEFNAK